MQIEVICTPREKERYIYKVDWIYIWGGRLKWFAHQYTEKYLSTTCSTSWICFWDPRLKAFVDWSDLQTNTKAEKRKKLKLFLSWQIGGICRLKAHQYTGRKINWTYSELADWRHLQVAGDYLACLFPHQVSSHTVVTHKTPNTKHQTLNTKHQVSSHTEI